MKKLVLLGVLILAGCSTTGTDGVEAIGPNHFIIGGLGGSTDFSGSAVKVRYFKEATKYCADKGMTMSPISSTSQDAAGVQWASAEVQFRCVKPTAQ